MKPSTKTMLGIGSLVGVVAGLMLSVGGVSTAAEQIWQKYGNTVRLTPTTTDMFIPQSDVTAKSLTASSSTIGLNGSAFDTMKSGTCTLFAYDNTISASSTDTVDCSGALNGLTAISGITSGDNCQLWATTTMSSTFLGLDIQFSHSSTTAGYIKAAVRNMTGADYTWAAVASTSVRYFCTSQ
jgi:hypothetical protein